MLLADFANPQNFPSRVRELPEEYLPLPDFSSMEKGAFSESSPFHATLETVTHMLLQESLVGYERNRGGQAINSRNIKKWFGNDGDGLCIEAIGEIPFGESSTSDAMTLATHHHRSSFLLYLYWMASEEIWDQIKDELISCRVYNAEKLIDLYVTTNNMTKQSKSSFLKNPDMVVGSIVSCDTDPNGKLNGRLASFLSVPARKLLSSKGSYLQCLANLIYARTIKTSDNGKVDLQASQASVYNCRQKIADLVEMPITGNENVLNVSDKTLKEISNAIEDYIDFFSNFKTLVERQQANGVNVETQKKIMKQTAFFAYYVYDRVVFKKLPSAKLVAERLDYFCNGTQDLGKEINFLWNGCTIVIDNRCDKIANILRKSRPRKAS